MLDDHMANEQYCFALKLFEYLLTSGEMGRFRTIIEDDIENKHIYGGVTNREAMPSRLWPARASDKRERAHCFLYSFLMMVVETCDTEVASRMFAVRLLAWC
jgi:hypothetical protein